MSIGKRLKSVRIERGYSQDQLAKLLSVSRGACGQWERESSTPSVQHLSELSCVLQISFDWLATGRGVQNYDELTESTRIAEGRESYTSLSEQQKLVALYYGLDKTQREALLALLKTL